MLTDTIISSRRHHTQKTLKQGLTYEYIKFK